MSKIVFDVETDGLLEDVTKIHCLSYKNLSDDSGGSITDYQQMREFVLQEDLILIGHNIVRYDIPIMNKILGISVKAELIDTLPLSWTLYPQYKKHGLEAWGEFFGVPKPEIKDWKDLSVETYIHRCEEDVKINVKLWSREYYLLNQLYERNQENLMRYVRYLSFKMDCVREQEEVGIRLDIMHCEHALSKLSKEKEIKVTQLASLMPQVPVKKKKIYDNALMDDDGNIFQEGDLFFGQIERGKRSRSIQREKIVGWEDPNPNSPDQIKNWLYSLGWVPETFKHVRDKVNETVKKIPQIGAKDGQGELCNSVKKLFDKEPNLEVLNGLGVLSHRIGLLKGFLKQKVGDRLYPGCSGLTNTLRLQHAIVVNLPGIDKKYGEEIRACLIADEGSYLCGCDLSQIEDNTKRHYIYKYDPKYVEEMNAPGFDSHLDIAVLAAFMTKEDEDFYKDLEYKKKNLKYEPTKEESARFHGLKTIRSKSKVVNFSATYKIGADSLARNSGMSLREAKRLLTIYWERNNAIMKVERSLKVKEIYSQKWLFNPVSKFWYTLRADKDKFSTLNQGTAVYVFDTWMKYLRAQGVKVSYQCHDEWLGNVQSKGTVTSKVNKAIGQVNEELRLNITVACSVEFGENYAECH